MAKEKKSSAKSAPKASKASKKESKASPEDASALFEALAGQAEGLFDLGAKVGDHRVVMTVQNATSRAYQLLVSELTADEVVNVLASIGVSLSDSDSDEEEADEDEEEEEEADEDEDEEEEEEEEEADEDEEEEEEADEEEEEEEEEDEEEEEFELSSKDAKIVAKCKTPEKVAKHLVKIGVDDPDQLLEVLTALRDAKMAPALKGSKEGGLKKLAKKATK